MQLSPQQERPKVDRTNSSGSATGTNDSSGNDGSGSGQIPRNPSRFLVNKVEGEDAAMVSVDEPALNGSGASPDGAVTIQVHRGVHFNVGSGDVENDLATGSDHQHTQGNTGTYGTANFKSFRALQTVEKIPNVDHYRNIMSVEGAIAARPTLAQLHDEEYGQQSPNHVDQQMGHFERFGLIEGDKNLVSAEYLRPAPVGQKFGWIQGVLMRCILSILGTMLYLRISWVAGVAGIGFGSLVIVVSAVVVTITAFSMCAISTNGEIKGGGAYYMISRSLGPEFGGSIGLIFSLANAVASAMCTVGFAEVVRDLLVNEYNIKIADGGINDVRIISFATIILILCVVIVGVSFEAKAQLVLLAILALSLVDYLIGTFIPPDEVKAAKGMTGYSLSTFRENFFPLWGSHNFFSIFAVFFPACTGIMAGANISGDLADPQKAIPKGTLWAILICMLLYVGAIWTTGMTFLREATGNLTEMTLTSMSHSNYTEAFNSTLAYVSNSTGAAKPKYGLLHNYQIMEISGAWRPLVTAGIFAATLSSALAAFVSAPKVFQAVCKDRLFPYIHVFGKGFGINDEPRLGYILTFVISLGVISIGTLDDIAPIISNFFLMSYALVNYACFDASFAGSPGFRPGFRYYNMWVSLFGAVLCIAVMFVISWWKALVTFAFVAGLYIYVLYRKPDVNWGSSTQAHAYKTALQSTLKVAYREEHVKNYRPQILVLTGNPVARPALVDFASNITKENSLLICGHVVTMAPSARALVQVDKMAQRMYDWFEKRKVKAFYVGVARPSLREGVQCIMQVAGLGKLKPNVVMLGFKNNWKEKALEDDSNLEYFNIIHDAFENNCGVAILRVPGGLDISGMMSEHNVGDTQNLKLPEPSYPTTIDATGSGMNLTDSTKQLSPELGIADSQQLLQMKIEAERSGSICSFADKLIVADAKNSKASLTKRSDSELDANGGTNEGESKEGAETKLLGDELPADDEGKESIEFSPEARPSPPRFRSGRMTKRQKEIMQIMNRFQIKAKKPVLHVFWLFDDGGLGLLVPHLLTLSRSYLEGAKLNVFTVAASRSQLEKEQRSMAALLSRFRIEYSDVFVIADLAKKPQQATVQEFEAFIAPFRAPSDLALAEEGKMGDESDSRNDSPTLASGYISDAEYMALRGKTYRQLRIREILLQHSRDATLIVVTLPVPRRGVLTSSLYLAWLDFMTKDLPPVLLLRGNQQSVLTFYS